jgi:hypothetical protein
VLIPAYAKTIMSKDINDDVIDVYDGIGNYKKRAENEECEVCGFVAKSRKYAVYNNRVYRVCSKVCADRLRQDDKGVIYD